MSNKWDFQEFKCTCKCKYDILNLGRVRQTPRGNINKGMLNDDFVNYKYGIVLVGTHIRVYFQFQLIISLVWRYMNLLKIVENRFKSKTLQRYQ